MINFYADAMKQDSLKSFAHNTNIGCYQCPSIVV